MAVNSEEVAREVERQFKMTDYHYRCHVEKTSIEDVLKADDDERIAILKAWGEIMETYLKGILRWKGSNWDELKRKKHDLKDVYDALDDVAKDMFKNFMRIKSSENIKVLKENKTILDGKLLEIYNQLNKNELSDANDVVYVYGPSRDDDLNRYVVLTGYRNGEWDGEATLDELAGKKKYSIETLCNMLKMIKIADFRYANAKGKFNDDFMRTMYDAVRSVHALTIVARGEKKRSI